MYCTSTFRCIMFRLSTSCVPCVGVGLHKHIELTFLMAGYSCYFEETLLQ